MSVSKHFLIVFFNFLPCVLFLYFIIAGQVQFFDEVLDPAKPEMPLDHFTGMLGAVVITLVTTALIVYLERDYRRYHW